MNEARLLTILKAPHVTEKSAQTGHPNYRQYAFEVAKNANKGEIKQAVEHLFKVKVHNVRICNVKSKKARQGRIQGQHKAWKKAYVTLPNEYEIDVDHIET